jgi:ankyrin repeat protein
LIEAARLGQGAVVRTLLAQRADANAREADGMTVLHWAVRSDDRQTVVALIKAGADVGATNRYGVTPLALAATNGNAEIVDDLLKAGPTSTARRQGASALMTPRGSRAAVKRCSTTAPV